MYIYIWGVNEAELIGAMSLWRDPSYRAMAPRNGHGTLRLLVYLVIYDSG